jgi:hypothetical protein
MKTNLKEIIDDSIFVTHMPKYLGQFDTNYIIFRIVEILKKILWRIIVNILEYFTCWNEIFKII